MKKTILLISILVFTFVYANAQQQSKKTDENINAPEIKFETTVHDYGTIPLNGDGNCEFKFTNTGKEPLILSNVRSSCGCTVPKWPKDPILPGKSNSIIVKYNTHRAGIINRQVTVNSNAKIHTIVLYIKGKVANKASE
jgi:hypothetical protein